MPTFTNPLADAVEASEALRALAHASRSVDDPAVLYPVIGDLLVGVGALGQILRQLADAHTIHQTRALDDAGNPASGQAWALGAADELRQAAALLERVEERVDSASRRASRVAWQPEPTLDRQFISVIFLQGEEAEQVLDLLNQDGPDVAITHLAQWDYGEETTQAAMENGYVYDTPPLGALDRSTTAGIYTLTYNPFHSYVSLLREQTSPEEPPGPEPTQAPAPAVTMISRPSHVTVKAKVRAPEPFTSPARSSVSAPARGLAL